MWSPGYFILFYIHFPLYSLPHRRVHSAVTWTDNSTREDLLLCFLGFYVATKPVFWTPILFVAATMIMSLLFHVVSAWFVFLLPCFSTFKALSRRSEPEIEKWCMYWTIIGALVGAEYLLEWTVSWYLSVLWQTFNLPYLSFIQDPFLLGNENFVPPLSQRPPVSGIAFFWLQFNY